MRALVALSFLLVAEASAAGLAPVDENLRAQQREMQVFFDDLSRSQAQVDPERALVTVANLPAERFTAATWREGASTPYKRAASLDALTAIAVAAAATVGTSAQGDSVLLLREQSAALVASGDPQMQQAGELYAAQATAIENGNKAEADAIAERLAALNRPDLAGYTPTADENRFASRMKRATGRIVAQLVTALGSIAGAILGAVYSGGTMTMQSAAYGGMLGNMLGNTFGSAISGEDYDFVDDAASMGEYAGSDLSSWGTDKAQAWGDKKVAEAAEAKAKSDAAKLGGDGALGGSSAGGSSAPVVSVPSGSGSGGASVLPGAK